jgi:hypothetical protein
MLDGAFVEPILSDFQLPPLLSHASHDEISTHSRRLCFHHVVCTVISKLIVSFCGISSHDEI